MPRLDMLRICGRRRLLLTRLGTGSYRSLPTNKALFSSSPVPAPAPASSAPSPTPAAATADSQAAKPQNSPGAKRGPISWATFALLLGTGTAAVVYYNVAREKKKTEASTKVETFGKAALGGPWSLVDSNGRPVSSTDFAGKYYLVYFGFTNCPDICPNELVKLSRAVDMYGQRPSLPALHPVFITLDPARDSCAQVGAYVRDFHPRMLGLTGTPGQIAKVAKRFRVYFSEVDKTEGNDDDYLVDHSIVSYLMSPEGEFLEFYTQILSAPEMAERLVASVEKHEREAGRAVAANRGVLAQVLGALGIRF